MFSEASGEGSTAVGGWIDFNSNALGDGGEWTTAQGERASAFGATASASGSLSTALGQDADASAAGAVALGQGSVADQANTVSVGTTTSQRRRSEEHTAELQSLMRTSYAVFCMKKKT